MDTEINVFLKNKTWFLVLYHPTMNLIGCKRVFKIKINLMALLTGIRPTWWPRIFINNQD